MKNQPLFFLIYFFIFYSAQLMANTLGFEYAIKGNNVEVKFTGDEAHLPDMVCPGKIKPSAGLGFGARTNSRDNYTAVKIWPCDDTKNWRLNGDRLTKQYVQSFGGVGTIFSIPKPPGVSEDNHLALFLVDEDGHEYVPWGVNGQGEGKPVDTFVTCSLGSSSLTFAHGDLTSAEVNGNSVSLNLSVTCSEATTVNITAGPSATSSTGSIPLSSDGALVSNISANGVKLSPQGTNINMPGGLSSISVSSTLQAGDKFNKAGSYSGNGVLVISPQ